MRPPAQSADTGRAPEKRAWSANGWPDCPTDEGIPHLVRNASAGYSRPTLHLFRVAGLHHLLALVQIGQNRHEILVVPSEALDGVNLSQTGNSDPSFRRF